MKNKLRLILYIAICFSLHGLNIKAQTGSQIQYFVPEPFPRSPTATAIEKYGTYHVNEFTGVPDISIPLYTIEVGGFQVPISLSYHASGIKVSDVASWAGSGWSVSAGGQITRRAMGLPDDMPYGYLNGYMYQPGTYSTSTYAGVYYLENVANGTYDSKPDIYSYDFPGHGGKFFFDGSVGGSFTPRMLPYAPLSVKYSVVTYSYSNPPPNTGLVKFNIADEHGNNYIFGNPAATEATYSSSAGRSGTWSSSTWKLQSMVSQNRRDTIAFTYQADTVNYPSADGEIYTVIDQINPIDTNQYNNASYSTAPTTPGNANVTIEKLPAQISFKNGKAVFDLDPAVRQDVNVGTSGYHAYGLNDIKVYIYNYASKTMELQKKIVFFKSYFNAGSTNYSPRLRLDSIEIQDKAGSTLQHYRFDYNNPQTANMPWYTGTASYQQDYWGYFNGKPNNMLTPQQTVSYQPNSINTPTNVTIGGNILNGRNCDSNYMQACILTGIHYPTGGYSTFTYQTNQYLNGGTLMLAGGLRIRSISSYDGVNPTPIVKTYVYNTARPNFLLDYDYFYTFQTHRYYKLSRAFLPVNVTTEVVRTFSSNPHCDLEAYDGATVVYPSVTEYIGTPGNNIGRTDFTFTDQSDATSDASMTGNLIYISSFYVRGHLLSKNEYNNLGSGNYQLLKSTTNTYTAFTYRNYNNVGLAVKKINYNEGPVGSNPFTPGNASPDDTQSYQYPYYYIVSDDNYLTSTTTRVYDTNNPSLYTTSTVNYTYDDTTHQQVASTTHLDSKGNTHTTTNKYAYNYLNGGTTTGNVVLDSMIERHIYADPVEKWDNLINAATSVNAVTGGQLNQYQFGSLANSIVPAKISTLSVAQPITNFTPSSVVSGNLTGDSRYVQMISFDQYDTQNNITHYTPRNATPTAIMWDYQYELPVAQVKNVPPVSNTSLYYAYTSFETKTSTGNWSYSGAPVYDVTAPTGFYSYRLSSGTINSGASLGTNNSYVLSYWSNNGSATVVYQGTTITGTALKTANGWSYYEHQLPSGGIASVVTISGSTSVDDLRLYPATAQMTTYAYDPSGLRSIADTKGSVNYFEYDFFQRLQNVKDWNGNIVKNYSYHTYDQTYGNQAQTATFTRNNCPAGTSPQSASYTVPANKYYSSTLASANADAVYDLNTNGQINADNPAVCGCPVVNVTVTVHNSTSATFSAYFSGIGTPYSIPLGNSTLSVPPSTYSTLTVNSNDSNTHAFTLGTRTPQSNVHNASFSNVVIATGSSDLTLTMQ